jgi:hypothetical protein
LCVSHFLFWHLCFTISHVTNDLFLPYPVRHQFQLTFLKFLLNLFEDYVFRHSRFHDFLNCIQLPTWIVYYELPLATLLCIVMHYGILLFFILVPIFIIVELHVYGNFSTLNLGIFLLQNLLFFWLENYRISLSDTASSYRLFYRDIRSDYSKPTILDSRFAFRNY